MGRLKRTKKEIERDIEAQDVDDYSVEDVRRMENGFRLFGTYYQGLWD